MAAIVWDDEIAEAYDISVADRFAPEVLDPTVDFLVESAGDGRVLEFAIGTGRVALPLAARGVDVAGIELSEPMIERLRAKPGGDRLNVEVGDMATARVPGEFSLVFLVFNTITNLTTQTEQVAVFVNAAAHLRPGGCFVVEVGLPQIDRMPPGDIGRVFEVSADHVGVETFDDDPVAQISWSHHWMAVEGRLVRHSAPYRFVWPAELDLMAQLAGLRVRERWGDWTRSPFTDASRNQVVVYERPSG